MAETESNTDKKENLQECKSALGLFNQYLAEVEFELPIYIPIPDGVYKVYANSMVAEVKLRRISKITSMSKSVRTSQNVIKFVPELRHDPFNGTEVSMRYKPSPDVIRKLKDSEHWDKDPYTEGPINPLLEESLLFVNKIVSTYQYYSGNAAIGRVQTWDIGVVRMLVGPQTRSTPSTVTISSQIGYTRPTVFTTGSPTEKDVLAHIIDKTKNVWTISSQKRLLLTARHLYLMGEYSTAVITSQSALELFLSRRLEYYLVDITIRKGRKEEHIPLKRAGLSHMIKHGLKQAIGKRLSDIDSSLAQGVTQARKLRNAIIHDGIDASMLDADKCIKTFSRVIDELESEL